MSRLCSEHRFSRRPESQTVKYNFMHPRHATREQGNIPCSDVVAKIDGTVQIILPLLRAEWFPLLPISWSRPVSVTSFLCFLIFFFLWCLTLSGFTLTQRSAKFGEWLALWDLTMAWLLCSSDVVKVESSPRSLRYSVSSSVTLRQSCERLLSPWRSLRSDGPGLMSVGPRVTKSGRLDSDFISFEPSFTSNLERHFFLVMSTTAYIGVLLGTAGYNSSIV